MTLSAVDDQASMLLMTKFYENIISGLSERQALIKKRNSTFVRTDMQTVNIGHHLSCWMQADRLFLILRNLKPQFHYRFKVSTEEFLSYTFSSSGNSSYGTRHGCCFNTSSRFFSIRPTLFYSGFRPDFMNILSHLFYQIFQLLPGVGYVLYPPDWEYTLSFYDSLFIY